MEDYQINRIYIEPGNRYSWQNKIKDRVAVCEGDGVTILAPAESGKTYFCREIISEYLDALNPGANILYYSADNTACDRIAVGCALRHKAQLTSEYSVVNDKQQAIMVPSSTHQLKKMLSSAMKFNAIIIDDADILGNAVIHSIVLKAMIDNANLILIGTAHEDTTKQLNKSVWKWLLNHPCYDAYEIIEPEVLTQEDESNSHLDRLLKILHPYQDLRAAIVGAHHTHTAYMA